MQMKYVRLTKEDAVATITIDRPGVMNAISRRVYAELDAGTRWLARRIAHNTEYALRVSKMSINQAADIMGQTAAVRASMTRKIAPGEPRWSS